MDSDDVLHILIKDLVGVLPDIELYDKEGNVEDGLYANVEYGALYNWYAATDARNIANTGWHMPTQTDYYNLLLYYDPLGDSNSNVAGGPLKETGLTYWNSPNTGATNSSGFNSRGTGYRNAVGLYEQIKSASRFWNAESVSVTYARVSQVSSWDIVFLSSSPTEQQSSPKKFGLSVRLIKDSTTLVHGQIGSYMGNDGKVYNSICIGTQEWLSENLKETKYRDGSLIPIVPLVADWSALTSAGMCYYDNDINYA